MIVAEFLNDSALTFFCGENFVFGAGVLGGHGALATGAQAVVLANTIAVLPGRRAAGTTGPPCTESVCAPTTNDCETDCAASNEAVAIETAFMRQVPAGALHGPTRTFERRS